MTPATRAEIGDLSPSGRSLIIPPRSIEGTVPGVIHDVGRGARTSPLPAGAGEDITGRRSPVPKARRRSGMSTESDAELVAGGVSGPNLPEGTKVLLLADVLTFEEGR